MPGKMSAYLQNVVMQKLLGQAAITAPSSIYLGICTAFTEADDGATFTEVTGTGYARQAITFAAPTLLATSNSGAIAFPKALSGWGTPTYWIIADALTSGHVLFWGAITSPLVVNVNELVEIDVAGIQVSLTGAAGLTLGQQIINTALRGVTWTVPAASYSGLLSGFTSDSVFTEISDANYARQGATWVTAAGGVSSNAARIQWAAAAAPFTVSHTAVFTASSGGTLLMAAALGSPKTVDAGKVFRLETGDLTVSLD